MKWVAFVAAVAILAIGVQVAQSAQSTPAASTSRISRLEKRVKTLETRLSALTGKVACLGAQPVKLRGNPGAGEGYVYQLNATQNALVTGYDATRQGEAAGQYFAFIDPSCVSSSFRLFSTSAQGRIARR